MEQWIQTAEGCVEIFIQHAGSPLYQQMTPDFEMVSNYGERWRNDLVIAPALVESTANAVVSKRFVKKQQMQWTLRGAHLLMQTRTKVFNGELEKTFREWYPGFRVTDVEAVEKAA